MAVFVFILVHAQLHAGIEDAARQVQADYGDSVVYLKAVTKLELSFQGQTKEQKRSVELFGTVVDKSGLVATSLSSLDMSTETTGPGGVPMSVKAEVDDLRILRSDGIEVPASMVMKDPDLDVALIRPTETPDEESVFIPVPVADRVEFEVLDEVLNLSLQEEDLDRTSAVRIGRISAVIKRPRRLYVVDLNRMGTPVFSADGKFGGIFLRKMGTSGPGSMIVLPVNDLCKVMDQIEEPPPKEAEETPPKSDAVDPESESPRKEESATDSEIQEEES